MTKEEAIKIVKEFINGTCLHLVDQEALKTLIPELRESEAEPEVDLEKEIDACWRNWLSPSNRNEVEEVLPKTEFAMYARHFYEVGRKGGRE